MVDVFQLLMTMVNIQAALVGVVATQVWNFFVPGTTDSPFSTTGGGWRARVAPAIGPVFATIACVALEWDGAFSAFDVTRGILSGFASEFMLRIYYKTIKGI